MTVIGNSLEVIKLESVHDIATLTVQDIHNMSKEDLIQVIVLGRIPFLDESRLNNQDLETLRRLAFLARNCSQNQAV